MKDDTYAAIRQDWIRTLRSRFDHELLDLNEVAKIYGYKTTDKVKKELDKITTYTFGKKYKKERYAIKDIASDLARRAKVP